MKIWLFVLCLMLPLGGVAEELQTSAHELIGTLELDALNEAAAQSGWFAQDVKEMLARLVSGQQVISAQELMHLLLNEAAGAFSRSVRRMARMMAPALLAGSAQWVMDGKSSAAKSARYAGMLMTTVFLVADLREHTALCTQTVSRMAGWMQALFPVLVTLLAAVGGTASSAFYQPAVMAAAGSMTTLVERVTLPLATGMAVLTMVGSVSEGLRLSRLCRLIRQAAGWTLGFGFTVFLGVMTVQGAGFAALDGVSIRTAKYAMDHFIPIVGGMFADTVDTLVGCSLLVHNAVGVLGLLLLLSALCMPVLRTLMTLFLYRACAAALEPISDGPLCRSIGGYADVFSLLFVIQLSVGAMFLLLVAQVLVVGNMTVMLR